MEKYGIVLHKNQTKSDYNFENIGYYLCYSQYYCYLTRFS